MKFITPFLLLIAFAFSACETAVNRRPLYSPSKASGPYTRSLKTGSWRRGEYPAPRVERKSEEPAKLPDLAEPVPAL